MAKRPSLEDMRRNLMKDMPHLYEYIAATEKAKALESIGDSVSGAPTGKHAANLCWAEATRNAHHAIELLQKGTP